MRFFVTIYIKNWFTAFFVKCAPANNDLQLMKILINYDKSRYFKFHSKKDDGTFMVSVI